MKITSWNVNGIRSVFQKGLIPSLKKINPDILLIQEIKAKPEQVPQELIELFPYCEIHSAKRPGYSGTMTLSKIPGKKKVFNQNSPFEDEGRTIIFETDDLISFNCYFPNGGRDCERVDFKLEYSRKIHKKAKSMKKATGKTIVISGDYNTAHAEIDLANPKTNHKTSGFLPIEREWMSQFLKKDFVDAFRVLHPKQEKTYSWWTYRNDCRGRNIGWRIDYHAVDSESQERIKKIKYNCSTLGSDHCPVTLELN